MTYFALLSSSLTRLPKPNSVYLNLHVLQFIHSIGYNIFKYYVMTLSIYNVNITIFNYVTFNESVLAFEIKYQITAPTEKKFKLFFITDFIIPYKVYIRRSSCSTVVMTVVLLTGRLRSRLSSLCRSSNHGSYHISRWS